MKSIRFEQELLLIKNDIYRENAKVLLDLLPDYFFKIPASTTGKYHPQFALGDGGLVRHTKVAVQIASVLLVNNTIGSAFQDSEKDLILIALLIHDGLKTGKEESEWTVHDHPLLISEFLNENKDKMKFSESETKLISDMVSSHMGEWNTNSYSNVELPLPLNRYQKFVHMCDFLASKKFLNVEFDKDNNIV